MPTTKKSAKIPQQTTVFSGQGPICTDPDHFPAAVTDPGQYHHICPSCKAESNFVVFNAPPPASVQAATN